MECEWKFVVIFHNKTLCLDLYFENKEISKADEGAQKAHRQLALECFYNNKEMKILK